jgi:uncharacterized protein YbjT (DUF2867 family)
MRIAVAGATGEVGRHVVAELERQGHAVVPLNRSAGVDLTQPDGLAQRLAGVDAVVDCSGVATGRGSTSVRFFRQVTDNLLRAEREAGVDHHVLLSIVGIDAAPTGYYRGKIAQEQVARSSGQPVTILRATQFHEFPGQWLDRARVGPVVPVPRMQSAPVAASEVGATLAELATGPAQPQTLEMGGPESFQLVDLVTQAALDRGARARVVPVRVPGNAGRAMRQGALVAATPWRTGTQTYGDWRKAQGLS